MVKNSLSFCLSGNVLISSSYLKTVFLDVGFLVESFFFKHLEYIGSLSSFWTLKFLMKNVIILLRVLVCDNLLLSACFQDSLS